LKKALLLVDRGSKEPEVRQELYEICLLAKQKACYQYSNYCFLEVVRPFIEEGIRQCINNGCDFVTIIPYFLYPGLKLKETVKQSAQIGKRYNLRIGIAKPLCYHYLLTQLVIERIQQAKLELNLQLDDKDCDVILIGHGSSDRRAREAFIYTVDSIKKFYHRVNYCFLELDEPRISQELVDVIETDPKTLLLMPYFLHQGSHIKYDVINEVNSALRKNNFKKAFMTKHLGVHQKLVELILQRADEVEKSIDIREQ
jgi:sirohydrochlorin ferrochelatase